MPRKVHVKKQSKKHGKDHPGIGARRTWGRFLGWARQRLTGR